MTHLCIVRTNSFNVYSLGTFLVILLGGCSSRGHWEAPITTAPCPDGRQTNEEYHPLFSPASTMNEIVINDRVEKWEQQCREWSQHGGWQLRSRWRRNAGIQVTGATSSVFSVKKHAGKIVASPDLPGRMGKAAGKGRITVLRTIGLDGNPVSSTILSGQVWTPRLETIGGIDLTVPYKITLLPNFDFEVFTRSEAVIPFANGYAINLFGAIIRDGVICGPAPTETYATADGRLLWPRLIRPRTFLDSATQKRKIGGVEVIQAKWKKDVEEVILRPSTIKSGEPY